MPDNLVELNNIVTDFKFEYKSNNNDTNIKINKLESEEIDDISYSLAENENN